MDAALDPRTPPTHYDAAADGMPFRAISPKRLGRSLAVLFTCTLLTAGCEGPSPEPDAGDGGCEAADGGCPAACEGADADGDGVADVCDVCEGHDDDADADGDGVADGCDVCAGHDDGSDADGDGVPDGCEPSGMFVDNGQQSELGYGRQATLGDLDGDGDLDAVITEMDIFFTRPYPMSVWLNDGTGELVPSGQVLQASPYAADGFVTLGDLDGDGDLDALAGGRIWLNEGDGTFIASGEQTSSHGDPRLADLDADGDLDLLNAGGPSGGTRVYMNDGTGSFTMTQDLEFLGFGQAETADIDGDGDTDAYVVSGGGHTVLLNDGSGTLVEQEPTSGLGSSFGLGDFDGDGDVDVVTRDEDWSVVGLRYNDGSGVFSDLMPIPLPVRSYSQSSVGDLDGDGDLDLLEYGRLGRSWLNDGSGGFVRSEHSVAWNMSGVLGDLDMDADIDILSIGHGLYGGANHVLRNDGNGSFHPPEDHLGPGDPSDVDLADLDGDGDHDAVVSMPDNPGPSAVNQPSSQIYLNQGDGTFMRSEAALPAASELLLDDVDGDGDPDALVVSARVDYERDSSRLAWIWLNDGAGTFSDSGSELEIVADDYRDITLVDMDEDGDRDLLYASSEGVDLWKNSGDGRFAEVTQVVITEALRFYGASASVGDVDGDIDLDIVVAGSPRIEIWVNDGAETFSPVVQDVSVEDLRAFLPRLSSISDAELTDIDGDEDLDIVSVWGQAGGLVLVNDGAGHYAPESGFPIAEAEGSDFRIELTDIDGDGDSDAVVSSYFNSSTGLGGFISVWNNDGLGQLSDTGQRLGPTRFHACAAADLDGNGGPDLFVANQGHFQVWLNQ